METVPLFSQLYGEGPPLLILHGLLGSSGNWHSLSKNVFGTSYEVHTLDLRNHGRSPHDPVFDFPSMTADVQAYIVDKGLKNSHILGHSMGGKVAMNLALNAPEFVRSLIVVDIAPRPYPPHHLDLIDALLSLDLDSFSSRADIDEALSASISTLGIRQFLLKNLGSDGRGGFYWKNNLDAIQEGYTNINVEIHNSHPFTGPTLFIRGTQSEYIKNQDLDQIGALFPNYVLSDVIGAGHWVHAERPQPFADDVLRFLAAH